MILCLQEKHAWDSALGKKIKGPAIVMCMQSLSRHTPVHMELITAGDHRTPSFL